jgi:hypothetical protein
MLSGHTHLLQISLASLSVLLACEKQEQDQLKPPASVSEEASLGLSFYEQYGQPGKMDLQLSKKLAAQSLITSQDVNQMRDFFENAQIYTTGQHWENKKQPSADWIRWLLMGGDAGQHWVRTLKELAKPVERRSSGKHG